LKPNGFPEVAFTCRNRTEPSEQLGVLAASFNPPTIAHLRMAELAVECFGLDEVVFELAKANVDKRVTGAPLHERLMMLRCLVAGREGFSVAASSHGRFLDKVRAFRRLFPAVSLHFIVGFDTLVRVFDAKYYANRDAELSELFAESRFICANRGNMSVGEMSAWLARSENRAYADSVLPMALDAVSASVSSTAARERLLRGEIPSEVPPSVLDYIRLRGLYRSL
jgi:nicotinate (nicotinamide) nucleotide adenylyltransferase